MSRDDEAGARLALHGHPRRPVTSLELDFDRRQPDLIVGTNEVYGQARPRRTAGAARLSAHLSPRSRVDVNWAVEADAGGHNPPLLTAQGDIAIDIDLEQMRTRSSWVIRCVRGMTRTLEIRVDEQDEVTEVRLDDQQTGAGIEGRAGRGPADDPAERAAPPRRGEQRLVLKTRRSVCAGARGTGSRSGDSRCSTPASSPARSASRRAPTCGSPRRRRRPCGGSSPRSCPRSWRERPGTSLAFEFLDQPLLAQPGRRDLAAAGPLPVPDPVPARRRSGPQRDDDRAPVGPRPAVRGGAGPRAGPRGRLGGAARGRRGVEPDRDAGPTIIGRRRRPARADDPPGPDGPRPEQGHPPAGGLSAAAAARDR